MATIDLKDIAATLYANQYYSSFAPISAVQAVCIDETEHRIVARTKNGHDLSVVLLTEAMDGLSREALVEYITDAVQALAATARLLCPEEMSRPINFRRTTWHNYGAPWTR
jgi:hypothetical protein